MIKLFYARVFIRKICTKSCYGNFLGTIRNVILWKIMLGRIDVCKYLVEEKKANINLEDDDGKNALIHAARTNVQK